MPASKALGGLTVASILASVGCVDCQQTCLVTSAGDLRALSASGFHCDLLDISETELTSLDGAEGIRYAFSVNIASNANLVDVSAVQEFSTTNFSLIFNPALTDVVLGPIGGGGIAISNNAVETARLKLTGDVELFFIEPALRELRLDGTPASVDLSFKDGIPATTAWDPVALNIETLRVRNVPNAATAADFEPLGFARDLVGIYGSGLGPASA